MLLALEHRIAIIQASKGPSMYVPQSVRGTSSATPAQQLAETADTQKKLAYNRTPRVSKRMPDLSREGKVSRQKPDNPDQKYQPEIVLDQGRMVPFIRGKSNRGVDDGKVDG